MLDISYYLCIHGCIQRLVRASLVTCKLPTHSHTQTISQRKQLGLTQHAAAELVEGEYSDDVAVEMTTWLGGSKVCGA